MQQNIYSEQNLAKHLINNSIKEPPPPLPPPICLIGVICIANTFQQYTSSLTLPRNLTGFSMNNQQTPSGFLLVLFLTIFSKNRDWNCFFFKSNI